MKGWSFRGLVEALKSAAFKNIGTATGDVPVVGDSGLLLPTTLPKTGFDFSAYRFKNNETLNITPPFTNWPFGNWASPNLNYLITVKACWGDGVGCVLDIVAVGENLQKLTVSRNTGGVWYRTVSAQYKELGFQDLNQLSTVKECGIWQQNTTANATKARNYPVEEAGVLEILPSPYGVTQRYTAFNQQRMFVRATQNETLAWGAWREFASNFDKNQSIRARTLAAPSINLPLADADQTHAEFRRNGLNEVILDWGTQSSTVLRGVYQNQGSYGTIPRSLGWRDIADQLARAPFWTSNISVGSGAWVPLTSQSIVTTGVGYAATIMTGIQNFNNVYPHWKVVWNLDTGHNTQFFFGANGDLGYDGGGKFPNITFASQSYAANLYNDNRNYINWNCVTDIALGGAVRHDYYGLAECPAGCVLTGADEQGNGWTFTYYRNLMKHYPARGWFACGTLA